MGIELARFNPPDSNFHIPFMLMQLSDMSYVMTFFEFVSIK